MPTALLLALSLVLAPDKLLRDPQAQAAFDAAQEAFAAKDYAVASQQLERAYMLEPEPELLYPWAQAQRNLDRCESAIDLYQKFIDTGPPARMVEAAKQNIARCEETLAAAQPTAEPDPEPQPEIDPEPPPPRVDPKIDAPATKPPGKDIVAGVLVGVGAVGVITGAALLGVAGKQAKMTSDVSDNSTYLDMRAQAKKLSGAGIAVLVTGGVLLIAGVVRYGVVARKHKASEKTTWWNERGRALVLSGRF